MYLSLVLLTTGVALTFDTLWPLLLLPFVVLVVRANVILPEERYLGSEVRAAVPGLQGPRAALDLTGIRFPPDVQRLQPDRRARVERIAALSDGLFAIAMALIVPARTR